MREHGSPPARADARRNRARVLEAARAAFGAEGRMVPLGEIARRAGVGAGTVYRHFPSKEDLFGAVIAESVERCVAEARELTAAADPGAAFFAFLERVVAMAAFNRALCDALAREAPGRTADGPAPGARREFEAVLGRLLAGAQAAGAVRRDVGAAEVRLLVTGCAAMEQGRGAAGAPGLLTAVMCDGLRPRPAVTEPRNETGSERAGRNETGAASRDETPRCPMCGRPLPVARTGRPARYCGAACRQKAHRRRTGGRAAG
ncbi:TetR/AcrR family transcriptional regulator [Streptomyces hoynatensis]|uniref:TetR/AcrR family transcriptional regulator n=1 Tax=Streptomyces hoynatensis TaxID=1141874 RepID=A0A3A9Z429_9ACTN|nr:TetR/AcrR family transcriptional regulator [Streptomyces hoynatensis]RKN43202.1 TetR/AcrR family transcriptional regulator [Streptomyces hoynatensis]